MIQYPKLNKMIKSQREQSLQIHDLNTIAVIALMIGWVECELQIEKVNDRDTISPGAAALVGT